MEQYYAKQIQTLKEENEELKESLTDYKRVVELVARQCHFLKRKLDEECSQRYKEEFYRNEMKKEKVM